MADLSALGSDFTAAFTAAIVTGTFTIRLFRHVLRFIGLGG